jgi:hypothetical protein
MTYSKDGIKRYTPKLQEVVFEIDEIPVDMTDEIDKCLAECAAMSQEAVDPPEPPARKRRGLEGLSGLLSRLKR